MGMTMLLPQVGHVPSCPDMLSVASRRLEQYPQLKPKRRPPARCVAGEPSTAPPPGLLKPPPPPPPPEEDDPAPTPAPAIARAAGTRRVVRHFGQRTSCPACPSSAESAVRQMLHS